MHIFEPSFDDTGGCGRDSQVVVAGTIVTVHPWAALGGGEHNMVGVARRIVERDGRRAASGVSGANYCGRRRVRGWRVATFALGSAGAFWGICTAHSQEVRQVMDVVNWVDEEYGSRRDVVGTTHCGGKGDGSDGDADTGGYCSDNNFHRIVLFGSSAGAPIAGTAMARLLKQRKDVKAEGDRRRAMVSAYVAVGYTFGKFASLGFGRHFSSLGVGAGGVDKEVLPLLPPRLFVMGANDEFTSVPRLEDMVRKMRGDDDDDRASSDGVVDVEIVPDVGHFELESPGYDPLVAGIVLDWLDRMVCLPQKKRKPKHRDDRM